MRMFDSQFALCTFVKRKSIYKINIHENVKTLFKISKLELLAKKKANGFCSNDESGILTLWKVTVLVGLSVTISSQSSLLHLRD